MSGKKRIRKGRKKRDNEMREKGKMRKKRRKEERKKTGKGMRTTSFDIFHIYCRQRERRNLINLSNSNRLFPQCNARQALTINIEKK
jgi:hypothetical protein